MSLKLKTILILGSLMLAITSLAISLSVFITQKERHVLLEDRASLLAKIQADALATPLWDLDIDQLQSVLAALSSDKDFKGASVSNDKGEVLAQAGDLALTADDIEKVASVRYAEGEEPQEIGTLRFLVSKKNLYERRKSQIAVSALALAVLMLILIAAINFALNMISGPLKDMTHNMSRLAQGELEIAIPALDRKDEIGQMSRAVQVFKNNALEMRAMEAAQLEERRRVEQQQETMRRAMAKTFEDSVQKAVGRISASVAGLGTISLDLSRVADHTIRQSAQATSASNRTSENVQKVSRATEELSTSIGDIEGQARGSARICGEAVTQVQAAKSAVESLTSSTAVISDIVEIITTIADQTNLLSLNATIESAHAGDLGKGFAIVAAEVKQLATQTTQAIAKVNTQVDMIQTTSHNAIKAIGHVAQTVSSMSDKVSHISRAVNEQNKATQDIADNVAQAAENTARVAEGVGEVNEKAKAAGQAAGSMSGAIDELKGEFQSLQREIDKFVQSIG